MRHRRAARHVIDVHRRKPALVMKARSRTQFAGRRARAERVVNVEISILPGFMVVPN